MRVDAHVHVWPHTARIDVEPLVAKAGTTESLIAAMTEADIGAAVLVQPSVSGLDHSYLLDALRSPRLRAVGMAQVDPEDAASPRIITRLLEIDRVVGFRLPLIRADDGWLRRDGAEYWAAASARGVVISLLAAPVHLEQIAHVAAAHPMVQAVIDHLARFDVGGNPRASVAKLCRLAAIPNVHVKASAIHSLGNETWPYRDVWPRLFEVIDAFGPERIVWGSDYPFVLSSCPYRDSLLAVEHALTQRYGGHAKDILGENALRLFFGRKAEVR